VICGKPVQIVVALAVVSLITVQSAYGHVIPPQKLHPVTEAYRRANFVLRLNPVIWEQARPDAATIAKYWSQFDPQAAKEFAGQIEKVIAAASGQTDKANGVEPMPRKEAAARVFTLMTKAVTQLIIEHVKRAEQKFEQRQQSLAELQTAQAIWASFEVTVSASDPQGYRAIGQAWLGMSSALGSPGLLDVGAVKPDRQAFEKSSNNVLKYTRSNFGPDFKPAPGRRLAPWPIKSPTFDATAKLPIRLPPGSNINKQVPRPRQILNMASRGVDEGETTLIALGDMAFDSAYLLGDPFKALSMTCNTCHNKGVTNPNFFIPGLSKQPGSMDVSNSYFAAHANNGHFDSLDIPDLRGIRFTAPYGRNGRFNSLREFVRNGIVNEFNGKEPAPMVLDGIIAYMNEFDFLPNPYLNKDGTLSDKASAAAKRGEKIFHRPFKQMAGKSCASCHIPSSHFLDHRSHDIGTVMGAEPHSLDRALDTPTLLSAKFTPPYFHDGSQPTLASVNAWFNKQYKLGLNEKELADLTAYVETVGDGVEAYEDTPYYLDAEMEEFGFFLSTYEFLDQRNKPDLMNMTFQTVATEIRNHKWELRDYAAIPVMDQLAELMDKAYDANVAGDRKAVTEYIAEYRKLYEKNVDRLK